VRVGCIAYLRLGLLLVVVPIRSAFTMSVCLETRARNALPDRRYGDARIPHVPGRVFESRRTVVLVTEEIIQFVQVHGCRDGLPHASGHIVFQCLSTRQERLERDGEVGHVGTGLLRRISERYGGQYRASDLHVRVQPEAGDGVGVLDDGLPLEDRRLVLVRSLVPAITTPPQKLQRPRKTLVRPRPLFVPHVDHANHDELPAQRCVSKSD
jgi:hypothetical protein